MNRIGLCAAHTISPTVISRMWSGLSYAMAGKGGMVHFDVHLEVLVEVVGLQEADHGLGVDIVLVLGGLHRLGFDQESAGKAVGAGIVACHGKHGCEMFFFTLLIGVEQAHIAFAAAPEYIIRTAESDSCVDSVLDLHACAGYNVEVGVGGCAVHVYPYLSAQLGSEERRILLYQIYIVIDQ